jgi:hypothetical protein
MSTDIYGYEEANPYGYGEATPTDASKLGYETTNDNKYGYESTDNVDTSKQQHGDLGYGSNNNDPYGYGDSSPYGNADGSQGGAPRARERPRRRGSVTKFSLDEVQEAKASFESSQHPNQEANEDQPTEMEMTESRGTPPPLGTTKSARKLWNPLSRNK